MRGMNLGAGVLGVLGDFMTPQINGMEGWQVFGHILGRGEGP